MTQDEMAQDEMAQDEMTGMTLIERKAVKLLAQGSRLLAETTAEALCDAPQGFVIRRQLADLRGLLDEFEDAYFDAEPPPAA